MGVTGLESARADFERGDWLGAYDAWSAADVEALSVADLDDLATCAELLGHHDETVTTLHRAFVASQAAGDLRAAVMEAFRLSMTTATHGEQVVAAGWTSRAEGLVEQIGTDCPERGWVAFLQMFAAIGRGDLTAAVACADETAAAGKRHGDPDVTAMGICAQGRLALYAGRVSEGLALLDEAIVRVLAGETNPIVAGHVYCTSIEGAQEISDFARVAEWTSALERWCTAQPGLLAFTGQCAVHRGQLLRVRGDWGQALDEFTHATARYEQLGHGDAVGLAAYEAGEVHRLRGEHDEADAAYVRASDHGFDPQPGLALLWLSLGQGAAARSAVDRLLAETGGPVQRVRLLPASVEVLLASGDVERAREVAAELDSLATGFGCAHLAAATAQAAGAVELAGGDASGALPYLRKSQQLWTRAEAPYDRARARLLTGRALAALGDTESSRRELEAARTTFRQLGARPAAEEVEALLAPESLPGGLTAREAEVLRLVAAGRSNAQIAAGLVLSEKTVARHLSNIFGKLDVGSRTAATAYAFEHGLV